MTLENELKEADYAAAESVLGQLKDIPALGSHAYEELRRQYAEAHSILGSSRFAFRFGLRPPATILEKLELDFVRGEITEHEFGEQVGEYATRPVDRLMLEEFFRGFDERLHSYSDVLRLIVSAATNRRVHESSRPSNSKIDMAIAKLHAKTTQFSDELLTVSNFLTDVQCDREAPIQAGELVGDTAHWVATLVFTRTKEAWTEVKEIAQRSQTRSDYLYEAEAPTLFYKGWIESGRLPTPDALSAIMRPERVRAFARLEDRSMPNVDTDLSSVFVVHGHDDAARETVARFIEKLGLRPVILHEQANKGQTIIEKLEGHSNGAQLVPAQP